MTKVTAPNDGKTRFRFTGPAPLQSTTPVACGDAGCVFNHLDWTVYGATVVSGCQVNGSTCVVTVPVRAPQWAVVYVRQNNDPKTLWAIWNSGKAVTISGKIDTRDCGSQPCKLKSVSGATVTANGRDGSGSATSGSDGRYSITVPPGSYTVKPTLEGAEFDPKSRSVAARSDQKNVDFRAISPEVKGEVIGHFCGENSCRRAGLRGVEMLVVGTAKNGSAVSRTTTTGSDGAYAISVPPGSYTVGATEDGKSVYDGPALTPGPQKKTVGSGGVSGVDFSACAESGSALGAAARAVASAASGATCTSDYAFTLKASVPQKIVVDPSELAPYNTNTNPQQDGFNSGGWVSAISAVARQVPALRSLALVPAFPECFSDADVKKYTEEHASIKFYSYYEGAVQLGAGKIVLQWNQSAQQVRVLRGPNIQAGSMSRVFVWQLTVAGKTESGFCRIPVPVTPVLSAVVSKAAGARGLIRPNEFALVMTWNFPGDPLGVKIDAEGSIGQRIGTGLHELNELFESSLPGALVKELGAFAVSFVGASKLVHVVKALTEGRKLFYLGETGINLAETLAELLHHRQTGKEVNGIIGGYLNYGAEEGAYPIMAAVVRGSFDTQLANVDRSDKANRIPAYTTLALSAATTNFPNVQLLVQRSTTANPDRDTYTGLLPWTSAGAVSQPHTSNLYISNRTFGQLPAFSLTNVDPAEFTSGKEALESLLATMKTVSSPIVRSYHLYGAVEGPLFGTILRTAPTPECTVTPTEPEPKSASTICWQFGDGRA